MTGIFECRSQDFVVRMQVLVWKYRVCSKSSRNDFWKLFRAFQSIVPPTRWPFANASPNSNFRSKDKMGIVFVICTSLFFTGEETPYCATLVPCYHFLPKYRKKLSKFDTLPAPILRFVMSTGVPTFTFQLKKVLLQSPINIFYFIYVPNLTLNFKTQFLIFFYFFFRCQHHL